MDQQMMVTMVEAPVDSAREADLLRAYHEVVAEGLGERLVETFLLREVGSATWRIVTVWRSRTELEEFRASGISPPAQAIFRAAGAEPALRVFEVAERATQ
jgi:hypothetical protein